MVVLLWNLDFIPIILVSSNRLGGPDKNSNNIRQLQTPLTTVEFHADLESGLHFDLWGRTPEHKGNFQFEVPMRRCYHFGAFKILRIVNWFVKVLILILHFTCLIWNDLNIIYHYYGWQFCRNFWKNVLFFSFEIEIELFRSIAEIITSRRKWRIGTTLSFHLSSWSDNI